MLNALNNRLLWIGLSGLTIIFLAAALALRSEVYGLAAVAALICLPAVFMIPIATLIDIELIITFVIVGLLVTYEGMLSALWVPYALAGVIFLRQFAMQMGSMRSRNAHKPPAFILVFAAFFVVLALTTLANMPSVGQLFVGFKIYGPIWLCVGAISYVASSPRFFEKLEMGALVLAVVQAPLVVWQHYVSSTTTGVSWDTISGTFGGNPNSGGANSTLLMMLIIAILVAIEMYRSKRLNPVFAIGLIGISMGLILLGEVKAVFFLLPAAIFVQQLELVRKAPITFTLTMLAILLALWGAFQFYKTTYWERYNVRADREFTLTPEGIEAYFFNMNEINYGTGYIGRGVSLKFWAMDSQATMGTRLFGYGAAASRTVKSSVDGGVVGKRFPQFDISTIAVTQLLWESGIVGTALFALSLVLAMLYALRLARLTNDSIERARMNTVAGILMALIGTLIYTRDIVDHPHEQLIGAILFGILLQRHRQRFSKRQRKRDPKPIRIAPNPQGNRLSQALGGTPPP